MEESTSNQIPGPPKIMASQPISIPQSKVKTIALVIAPILAFVGMFIAMSAYGKASKLKSDLDEQNIKVAKLDKRLTAIDAPLTYVQEQIEKDKYQAVFLAGGQVYFGKITHIDASTLTIEDIYHLRTGSYQQGGDASNDASLVKLGNELHGPEDKMVIERKNVTFWENLKTNSKVTEPIKAYQKQNLGNPKRVLD